MQFVGMLYYLKQKASFHYLKLFTCSKTVFCNNMCQYVLSCISDTLSLYCICDYYVHPMQFETLKGKHCICGKEHFPFLQACDVYTMTGTST